MEVATYNKKIGGNCCVALKMFILLGSLLNCHKKLPVATRIITLFPTVSATCANCRNALWVFRTYMFMFNLITATKRTSDLFSVYSITKRTIGPIRCNYTNTYS